MYWEIVELENGEIALQAADGDDAPLMTIQFSEQAKDRLQQQHVEIAKVMISAGMAVAQQMDEERLEEELEAEEDAIVH